MIFIEQSKIESKPIRAPPNDSRVRRYFRQGWDPPPLTINQPFNITGQPTNPRQVSRINNGLYSQFI